ncbi:Purple acid phosphatase 27 [Hibiscus syriacus]|uniref:Snurportin-1 n=1 Tax=Hibiscus syriacus TaxID=106335 RepID=A0A6A3CQK9_HIBSY|nr:Purple acid phosphatase 27 [Hibiscus syriacus]
MFGSMLWSIWQCRNKIIFDPEIIMGENVVQQSSRLTEEVFHAYRQKASDLPKYYVGTGIGKGTVPPVRRPFKRAVISDQQKRRELSLLRQAQNRCNAQHQARCLASSILSLQSSAPESEPEQSDIEIETVPETEYESENLSKDLDVRRASTLRGPEVRKWFARQLILPEWMIDVPDRLSQDCSDFNILYVLARPAGKRCFVVSSNGTTVSRQLNGSILHYFPSALPAGAKTRNGSGSAQSYCILDFIFHESDQTYYVIDTVCWNGYSLYDCTVEFRFYWLNSKLEESCACNAPSHYHKFRFSAVSVYNCDQSGLYAAYTGAVPYVKDGLLFYNKHAHYQTGNTLVLVWKDENCSQYAIDTDVLELQDDRKLVTSDDPPVLFGCLDGDFIEKSGVQSGNLLRFAIGDGGLSFVDGKLEKADLIYLGKSNRARTFADSYSKPVEIIACRSSNASSNYKYSRIRYAGYIPVHGSAFSSKDR